MSADLLLDTFNELTAVVMRQLDADGDDVEAVAEIDKLIERVSSSSSTHREPSLHEEALSGCVGEEKAQGPANDNEGEEGQTAAAATTTATPTTAPSGMMMPLPEDPELSNLCMSWYYAGYYTGRYQAWKEMSSSSAAAAAPKVDGSASQAL
ncbi:hypothetical protein FOZ61_009232 [Perkinsus olseni]|uniref:Uncharacterized protein n=1 Tax=Perkinsus olseni TaxID=32597 RepID=A0A7J6M5R0_PEROL|nr:hypothetical protein FOZ61_009232 [Perkinsus olseni]KAF4671881.1 hypothetical protein FOL46_009790 [Perkinsus olseni]